MEENNIYLLMGHIFKRFTREKYLSKLEILSLFIESEIDFRHLKGLIKYTTFPVINGWLGFVKYLQVVFYFHHIISWLVKVISYTAGWVYFVCVPNGNHESGKAF